MIDIGISVARSTERSWHDLHVVRARPREWHAGHPSQPGDNVIGDHQRGPVRGMARRSSVLTLHQRGYSSSSPR